MGNCNSSPRNRMSNGMRGTYMPENMRMYQHDCSAAMHDRKENWTSEEFPIGMAYVPWQKWRNIYEPNQALKIGTIFAELDKPFLGMRGVKK